MSDEGTAVGAEAAGAGGEAQPTVTSPPTSESARAGSEGNPAWKDVLDTIPTSLHSLVTPKLEQWDRQVNQRFQQHAESIRPYKDIMDKQIDPELIMQSLNLMYMAQNDPQRLYDALRDSYGLSHADAAQVVEEQAQGQGESLGDGAPQDDPRIGELQTQVEQLSTVLREQFQAEEAARYDQEFASEIESLKAKYGDFENGMKYVLTEALNDVPLEKAVQNWFSMLESAGIKPGGNGQPAIPKAAPTILSAGGGLPSEATKTSSLTPAQRRQLVADMLKQSAEQG